MRLHCRESLLQRGFERWLGIDFHLLSDDHLRQEKGRENDAESSNRCECLEAKES
jgi:hypothetical protein